MGATIPHTRMCTTTLHTTTLDTCATILHTHVQPYCTHTHTHTQPFSQPVTAFTPQSKSQHQPPQQIQPTVYCHSFYKDADKLVLPGAASLSGHHGALALDDGRCPSHRSLQHKHQSVSHTWTGLPISYTWNGLPQHKPKPVSQTWTCLPISQTWTGLPLQQNSSHVK